MKPGFAWLFMRNPVSCSPGYSCERRFLFLSAPIQNPAVGLVEREEAAHRDARVRTTYASDAMQNAARREQEQISRIGLERREGKAPLQRLLIPLESVRHLRRIRRVRRDGVDEEVSGRVRALRRGRGGDGGRGGSGARPGWGARGLFTASG